MPISNVQAAKMKRAYGHNLYVINEEAMYGPDFQLEESEIPATYEIPHIESSVLDSQHIQSLHASTPGLQKESFKHKSSLRQSTQQ